MTDFNNILGKAKELEEKMRESQKKIKQIQADGSSGGDKVRITLNGDGEIIKIFIADDLLKDSKNILEDLIIAAHNNAKENLKEKTSSEISKITGQFGIPGFKWPF